MTDPVPSKNQLTIEQLRDFVIRAHGMATGNYVQSDSEMRKRIGEMLESVIDSDDVMRGFLGRGGPCSDRDILGGNGGLAPEPASKDLLAAIRAKAEAALDEWEACDTCARVRELIEMIDAVPAPEPAVEHGGRIMTLAECVEAEGGIPFQAMEASTEPLTHQEIFSAVLHHANEIVRLTACVPAACTSQPPRDGQ
jgi:hypothetical protein